MPANQSVIRIVAAAIGSKLDKELVYALGNVVRSDRDRRDRQLRIRFYRRYGRGGDGVDQLDLCLGPVSDGHRPGAAISGAGGLSAGGDPAARARRRVVANPDRV